MFANGFLSWFSKPSTADEAAWDASTAAVQTKQPSSPKAPSTERGVNEHSSQDNMKLRGGGAGDVCCGLYASLSRVLASSALSAAKNAAKFHHRSLLSQYACVTPAPPEKQITNVPSVET
ncbi:unnamed protein product [Penicillium bialowiezense]